MNRRDALKLSVLALVPTSVRRQGKGGETGQDTLQPSTAALRWPGVAGRERERVTDYENDPFIVGVEEKLRCTCGCNLSVYVCRTTDFTCTVSPAMHREVIALFEEGKDAQEILDAFVARYGEMVLMAPPKEGFNIAGYVVPGIAIVTVGGLMVWLLAKRTRRMAAVAAAHGGVQGAGSEGEDLSPDEAARLEAELERLEL